MAVLLLPETALRAASMRNLMCALSGLILIAGLVTSADLCADMDSRGSIGNPPAYSGDGVIQADHFGDPVAFVEPLVTTLYSVERFRERTPRPTGATDVAPRLQVGSAPAGAPQLFPWIPASSSVRRAHLLVYRL